MERVVRLSHRHRLVIDYCGVVQAIPGQQPDCAVAAVRPALPFPASRMNTAQHVDVVVDKRRKSGDIRLPNLVPFQAQLVERSLHADRVPKDDHVNDESERPELILLSLPIALTQFGSFAVEDSATQAVSSLTSVELGYVLLRLFSSSIMFSVCSYRSLVKVLLLLEEFLSPVLVLSWAGEFRRASRVPPAATYLLLAQQGSSDPSPSDLSSRYTIPSVRPFFAIRRGKVNLSKKA